MTLEDLSEALATLPFPATDECLHPAVETVRTARQCVETAIADDDFLADCLRHELRLVARDERPRGLVPFYTLPPFGIRLAFGYWSPGGSVRPHEHTAWTVTAVCRNQLHVVTFDREQTYRRRQLMQKNSFRAAAGRVGFIYAPAIHAPRNDSTEWSLSLHVTSPRDGDPLSDQVFVPGLEAPAELAPPPKEDPYERLVIARDRERLIATIVHMLRTIRSPTTSALLPECFQLASASATRRRIQAVAPEVEQKRALDLPWVLRRMAPELVLRHRNGDGKARLVVETADGALEQLVLGEFAGDALAFAARESTFDVRSLPGTLGIEERRSIADALEATALFSRIW